jgi:glutamate/tyrosine decarboxylase-like PLP-dependent enzyme
VLAASPGQPTIVLLQAGDLNTGSFDPFLEIIPLAHQSGAWVHVDGAFGLWAAASPAHRHFTEGIEGADSWATDGHKWLNVTYDCGMAFFRDPTAPRQTFSAAAGYLPVSDTYDAMHNTPQSSQRARQVEVWAVLRTLGRTGLAELIGGTSLVAQRIAHLLAEGGFTILNDVVLNQVLVRPPDPTHTDALITAIQQDGRIWCGPTQWQGSSAMRISVSSWKTTLTDGEFAASVILELAAEVGRA